MRMLLCCKSSAGLPDVRPGMSLVWGATNPASRSHGIDSSQRDRATEKSFIRLDGYWARRDGVAPTGEASGLLCAEWPGKVYGVRAPEIGETPVSASEWPYLFRGDLQGEMQ
jgi:hypothetical protein